MPGSAPLGTQLLDPLPIEPDRDELMRYLGYRGSRAKKRALPAAIEFELAHGEPLLHPRGTYSIYEVERATPQVLTIRGLEIHGDIASFLAGAERVAVFGITVGSEISERASARAVEGDIVAAFVLDALGSFAAEAAAASLTRNLRRSLEGRASVSARFSPGYCGMDLESQRVLLSLVDAASIGLSLQPTLLMQPTKSISGLLGIGATDRFVDTAVPCERCNRRHCTMRR